MLIFLKLILGFICLLKGGDLIVQNASKIAKNIGVSDYVIGLTLVSLGTSLPELVINIFANLNQKSDLIMGNIIGSNIANTCLILGLASLIFPLSIKKKQILPEMTQNALLYVLFILCILTPTTTMPQLTPLKGLFLLTLCFIYIIKIIKKDKPSKNKEKKENTLLTTTLFIIGCIILPVGGHWTIQSSILIAQKLLVSEAFISIFALAIGTSLPEMVTTIMAAIKHKANMAIGNIIGSNILNISFVLGLTALIKPIIINPIFKFDLTMLLLSISLLIALTMINKSNKLNRYHGSSLLLLYLFYTGCVFLRG